MTDPKEEAIQRLANAFRDFWDNPSPQTVDDFEELARIAIEQGVVPAVKAEREDLDEASFPDYETGARVLEWVDPWLNNRPIPWDAVCPPKVTDGA